MLPHRNLIPNSERHATEEDFAKSQLHHLHIQRLVVYRVTLKMEALNGSESLVLNKCF